MTDTAEELYRARHIWPLAPFSPCADRNCEVCRGIGRSMQRLGEALRPREDIIHVR
jgi:hypothetical protein